METNTIMYVRSLFRLKKEVDENTITDVRNCFRLKRKQTTTQSKYKKLKKKENKGVKDKILRDIRNLFEQEVKDYYKPAR